MPSPTKTLARGTAWSIITAVFLKFLGFLYTIALTRLFTNNEAELGIFFYVFGIAAIIAVFSDLGLGPGALGRYIPYYVGRGEYNHVKAALKISLRYGTLFSLICMIAMILLAGPISDMQDYSEKPELKSYLKEAFYIMAFFLLFVNFYSIAINFLSGKKRFRDAAQISNLQGLAKFILTLILVFLLGSHASSVSLGFVLSFAVAGVWGCTGHTRNTKGSPHPRTWQTLIPCSGR
jgi:O-antigen/teichoic acid export membrane protein